jgi:hypothetical protein
MITLALRSCLSPRIGAAPCRWEQRLQHTRVDRALSAVTSVAATLVSPIAYLEAPAGCPHVTTWADEHVDDLAEPVGRTLGGAPPSSDLHAGLVHAPAVPNPMAARSAASARSGLKRSTHR